MTYRLLAEHGGVREFVVIFATGDEVMSGIHDFATREHVTAARLTAVGALERVTVGWLDRERQAYLEHPIDEQVELVSLVGDLATHEGEPAPHVHVVVGLHDGTTRGGHLIAATTYPTVELFVTAFPTSLQKRLDPASGVALIRADLP